MANRNTRIVREEYLRARSNLVAALADRSQPVEGRSWVYWQGAVDWAEATLRRIEGTK